MLSEDGNSYDFEPSDIKLEDLYIDDEDEKKTFHQFNDKKKFLNWHYNVCGSVHKMAHPHAEEYLVEVQDMRDDCIDMLYNALEGGFQILSNITDKNKILTRKIITKNVRKFLNSKKNKSEYYIYLTIRPDYTKITIEEFKTKITKLFKLKCIDKYYYTFEQKYGSLQKDEKTGLQKYTNFADGFHIHGLLKFNTNQNFGNANQQLLRAVKGLKMYYEIKKYIGSEIWADKMYYMGVIWTDEETYIENLESDYKDDEDKNLSIPYDKEFRRVNNMNYLIS